MVNSRTRLASLAAGAALTLAVGVIGSAQAAPRQAVVQLPDGFSPEGVATGSGNSVYVGSLRDGDIWRGDLRTGSGGILVDAPAGRSAAGLKIDTAGGRIFVAGAGTGQAYVYDARTGAPVATFTLNAQPSFINDVTLTPQGAWFTDSVQPVLHFVPFGPGGSLGTPRDLPLSGPAADTSGQFNLNGIAATPDGHTLIVAHSGRGELLTVDPVTGSSATIDLRGAPTTPPVVNADGILLDGKRIWVVQNFSNQVSEFRLSPDLSSGQFVATHTDPDLRIPTTIARSGNTLAVVNARFDLGIPGPLDAHYEVVTISR